MPRAAVLGRPIGHSLSPALHRAAYDALGLVGWEYGRADVGEADLPAFLDGLDDDWAGLSLTMPLKAAVIPLLDEIDPAAQVVRAVNTVTFAGGRRSGSSTDVPGMAAALRTAGPGVGRGTTAVLGGGATARCAVAALAELGATAATVYARRAGQRDELVSVGAAVGVAVAAEPWERADEALLADLVVSTVPAGAADGLAVAVPAAAGALLDVVYAPWPTVLAAAWEEHDGTVVGGLEYLVAQAALQVLTWTGLEPPVEIMRAAGLAAAATQA